MKSIKRGQGWVYTTGVGIIVVVVCWLLYHLYFAPMLVYGQGMIGANLLSHGMDPTIFVVVGGIVGVLAVFF